jgi:hypothetical protein
VIEVDSGQNLRLSWIILIYLILLNRKVQRSAVDRHSATHRWCADNPDKPVPVASFELFGGLRYTYLNQDTRLGLNATLTDTSGQEQVTGGGSLFSSLQFSIFEPFVGMRLGLWLTQKFNLLLKADCGGFGFVTYNHVDSVLEALVGYQVHKNIRIYGGYRGCYGFSSESHVLFIPARPLVLQSWRMKA